METKTPGDIKPGLKLSWSRLVSEEDIARFAEISGDRGSHHVEKDASGRLLAQGLLTATLPTKLGGDANFIARDMHFEFLRPVYSGDALTCVGTVESVEPEQKRLKVVFSFEITNQNGKIVLRGASSGVILL
ncbi:MAG: hypothetical protein HY401_03135 [Elusimicrobia bacterium]|nr:hypothetical protein [Elusimicrobiota bacterium]